MDGMLMEMENQENVECEEKEVLVSSLYQIDLNESNVMEVESDYSENEQDGSYFVGMMSFEEKNFDSENKTWGCSKKKKVDDCGVFKVIACQICHRKFSRRLALEHHLARIHRLSEDRINFFLNRVMYHSAQNYRCDTCKKVFYKEDKLSSHVCVPAVAVMCEICQQKFTSKTGLRRHLLAVHQLGNAKVDSIMEELADYNSRLYKKFKIAEDIIICSSDGRIIIKEGGSEFKTIEGPKCTVCNKAFLDECTLKTHVCECNIDVSCQVCKYKAPTKYNLKRHFILRHKLSEIDINLAMAEFNCYNEKWILRTHDSNNKLKKKASSRLTRAKSLNSFSTNFGSSTTFRAIAPKSAPNFHDEERAFSSSDEQRILNDAKTCKICYKTFESHSLFEKHYCEFNACLKDGSAKQFKKGKIKTEVKVVRKLVCEVCQSEFSLRIALKRHLLRSHNLNADAIDAFMERASNYMDVSDCEIHKEESDDSVNLISHAIKPISCEVCHQKLYAKRDLKGHLIKCFKMKESSLSLIFDESKDYYAKFYEREQNRYDLAISSSDGRFVCKKKDSAFLPVPGPRCKKCNKAFVDEFRIVGHECASLIKITCKICNKYTAPTKYKVVRHLVKVHKQRKDDIHFLMKEFKGYSERLNLRVKKWPTDRPVDKLSSSREILRVRVKNRSSDFFEEDKESMQETKVFIKEEKSSDSDCSYSPQAIANLDTKTEISDSDCDSEHQVLLTNSSKLSDDWEPDTDEVSAETKRIICEICKRQFCRKLSLKKHLSNIHRLRNREVENYLRRIAYESVANFKCNVCKKQFYKESRLNSHDCTPAIAVLCELCQSKLTSKISLRRHLRFSHKLEESKINSILEELSGFNSKFYKKRKIQGNEIAITSSDGRIIKKKNNFRLVLYSGPRCNVCYKALSGESTAHECARQIEIGCEICKYKSPSKYNLKRHLMLIHKISENEAKLAMQEFNRYSEKMELRE